MQNKLCRSGSNHRNANLCSELKTADEPSFLRFLISGPKTIFQVLIGYKNIDYSPVISQNFAPPTCQILVLRRRQRTASHCGNFSLKHFEKLFCLLNLDYEE